MLECLKLREMNFYSGNNNMNELISRAAARFNNEMLYNVEKKQ